MSTNEQRTQNLQDIYWSQYAELDLADWLDFDNCECESEFSQPSEHDDR